MNDLISKRGEKGRTKLVELMDDIDEPIKANKRHISPNSRLILHKNKALDHKQ